MKENEKQIILESIKKGIYDIEVEEPYGISECTNYKGEKFLWFSENCSELGFLAGNCTIHIEDYVFVCNLNTGVWKLNDEDFTDLEIISALEDINGVFSGEHKDGFDLAYLYAIEHNLPEDITFCGAGWSELKDIEDLGDGEVVISVFYKRPDEDEWNESGFVIYDGDLFNLYKYLNNSNLFPKDENEFEFSDSELSKAVPKLYEDLYNQIEEESSTSDFKFKLILSHEVFDELLYGEPYN